MATGVPVGLGEPVFGRLDADLAGALMGINAVKAVGIGDGPAVVSQRGTEHRDEMNEQGFEQPRRWCAWRYFFRTGHHRDRGVKTYQQHHHAGQSIDTSGNAVEVVTKGRHDPCVGIRATPIAEAMVALVLMDHLLRNRGQMGQ